MGVTIRSPIGSCILDPDVNVGRLTWVDPATIAAAGIEPWRDLPIWIPPGKPRSGTDSG